jgi:5'-3' exonuclease
MSDAPQFLLIDGSYFMFYRYFALEQWWKHSHPDEPLENPSENEEFMKTFRKVFVSKIREIIKKLKLVKPIIIVGLDCPRKDIWRNAHFDAYKAHRDINGTFKGGPVFKIVHEEELFKKAGAHMSLRHPHLEADDCLALTVRNIRNVTPDSLITIITSDMDYLQLADEKTKLFNLKYKDLTMSKNCFKDKKKDLFCKIVMGDKSDGISPIFKKCGIKTAAKCYDDPEFFKSKMEKEPEAKEKFEKNTLLVDFRKIPQKLVDEFNTGEYTTKY